MAEPRLTLPGDDDDHDLPRTLRRARAERGMDGSAASAGATYPGTGAEAMGSPSAAQGHGYVDQDGDEWASDEVTVTRIRVPFFHLMGFFVKAVFAAIPALVILTIVLIGIGTALKSVFPGLRQAVISIEVRSPDAPPTAPASSKPE